jgi:glycosyltransferase involved in cell wall biosynthesis
MDNHCHTKQILAGLISHNRFDFTLRALETLVQTDVPLDIVIVDNGSEKETKRKLHEVALSYGAHFISIENRNCNGARDMINHYGLLYDYILYLDNDVLMPPYWLEQMLDVALETDAGMVGVSQSEFGNRETFFGDFLIDGPFITFRESSNHITRPQMVDWVTGHCLMVKGEFLRTIWIKYRLWERRSFFPIDLDDIDLMMMAKSEQVPVYVAPLVIPQNRDFKSNTEAEAYNGARNDFHNYALSCVSFWHQWGLNPLLNWNKGYTGNSNKEGYIHNTEIECQFMDLVEMLRDRDEAIYESFRMKLSEK